ncbi:DUF3320 domain-containing protein [Gluconobacter cerinus]|uniref:DUF4011 domain-containing protein n=1 Tax=Gluconobacter TaxID=441 RepID=UPI001B8B8898|nr:MULTISPECIES: DUF3320 domain-containing protein [Gluconobacter]MBS0995539.1 DUF3320 domain-containing protein [Gluconobacter cerinus]MBS1023035.1 DUF3320 domain-containing protein [Gluconobacter cerinus]
MTDSSPDTEIMSEGVDFASVEAIECAGDVVDAEREEGATSEQVVEDVVALTVVVRESVSSALWENSVPVLLELAVRNLADRDLSDVEITLHSKPGVLRTTSWRIQSLGMGQFRALERLDVELDGAYLASLSEATRAEVHFTVSEIQPDGARVTLLERVFPLTVRCRSEWGGLQGLPDLLAAFVLPNDPAVAKILRSASLLLQEAGHSGSLEGYQGGRKRAWEQAQAIWCAIAGLNITYVSPPASFVEAGQRVRLPTQIVEDRLATCLDTALLFASCLEAVGLRPLLIMLKGHAFAGLWLSREQSGTSVIQDLPGLRNRVALDDVCVFETTLVTAASCPDFAKACERGLAQLQDDGEESKFEEVIDVHRARLRRIRPLSSLVPNTDPAESDDVETSATPQLKAAPDLREELGDHENEETPESRLDRWCKRLLDISGRSRLLNLPRSEKQIIEICCADPGRLEDRLAEMRGGERKPAFRLRARPELMDGSDPRSAALHQQRHHDDQHRAIAAEALEHGELLVARDEASLQSALTEIYRKARAAAQEGGANTLFLTLGELVWEPRGRDRKARAPLILVPVILERSSINAPFRLRAHTDESRVNGSLLEVLRQDFAMRFPELEGELPQDEAGLDVARIFDIFRAKIRQLPQWEVQERVSLTTLSFAKFLMWKDLQERRDALRINPVASRLLDGVSEADGTGSAFPTALFEEQKSLDNVLDEASLLCPMEADSSQLTAVARAAAGENFVLIGPPGTGKSQTIANIIADTLGRGKTVLFVAEKRTALEVVRNRLRSVGLSEFCLDLFSPQAGRGAVLEQFQQVQLVREEFSTAEWTSAQSRLMAVRQDLNAYVQDLHKRWNNGWTPYQAIGVVLEADRNGTYPLALKWSAPDVHAETDWESLKNAASLLAGLYERFGRDALSPQLLGIEQEEWTSRWQDQILQQSQALRGQIDALSQATDDLCHVLGLTGTDRSLAQLHRLQSFCALLYRPEAAWGAWALSEDAHDKAQVVLAEKERIARHCTLEQGLAVRWSDAKTLPLEDLHREWKESEDKWLLSRRSAQKAVRRRLEASAKGVLPDDLSDELSRLLELSALERDLKGAPHREVVGSLWSDVTTDFEKIEAALLWGTEIRTALASCVPDLAGLLSVRRQIRELLTEGRDLLAESGPVGLKITGFRKALSAAEESLSLLADLAGNPLLAIEPDGEDWLLRLSQHLTGWLEQGKNLRDWCAWRKACHTAERLGLGPLVDALVAERVAPKELQSVLTAAYARWWLAAAVDEQPRLRGFVAAAHEEQIERFKIWDGDAANLAGRLIRARLSGNIPAQDVRRQDSQYVIIHREAQKKARHMPIRQLAAAAPRAVRALTPCFMMSPLSVAQYLPPDSEPFDLVIFDEASQIPTWDAIGAIGRGRQVIVVGDPKQLPPTSFFARSENEDDDGELCDMESILDECRAAGVPEITLKWHYRSRHESLIAFSNSQYYGGDLITFPSNVTQDRAVSFQFVEGGNYQRGGSRTNPTEARAVADAVVRHLKTDGEKSVGVVTFNGEQQTLITDLLEKAQMEDSSLVPFFSEECPEPVLIRNLENVQGEERDVMFFSLTYAPELKGAPYVSFGPLNRAGGERRLNVAVTRAREKLVVFGSLRAEQIDPSRSAAEGVLHLRKFLTFAEHGAGALAGLHHGSVGEEESRFELEVSALLRQRGWDVRPQIGVSRFRIDLGVVDPDMPGSFLAGVECDGATYHRSATARDRDRLRQAVLENLGWVIFRVWSTDWWLNANREVERLDQALKLRLEAVRESRLSLPVEAPDIEVQEVPETESALVEEPSLYAGFVPHDTSAIVAAPYIPEDDSEEALSAQPDAARFTDDDYLPVLQSLIQQALCEKGVLHETALIQKIARQHGFARAGRQIRERVLTAIPDGVGKTTEDAGTFFWETEDVVCDPETVLKRDSGESVDPAQLPMSVLTALAKKQQDRGLGEEEGIGEMRKACGLGRIGATSRLRFHDAWLSAAANIEN